MPKRIFTGHVDTTGNVPFYVCVCGTPLNIIGNVTTDELQFTRFIGVCRQSACEQKNVELKCVRALDNPTFKAEADV